MQAMRTMEAQNETSRRASAASAIDSAERAKKEAPAIPAVPAAGARWRISAAGGLERALAGADWQTVLSPAAVRLQALAVIGENVWAGGSRASLFHSSDGGAHWTEASLARRGSALPTITSIKFDDALHGSVEADDGSVWLTSDGGSTWTLR